MTQYISLNNSHLQYSLRCAFGGLTRPINFVNHFQVINDVEYSAVPRRKIIFYCISNTTPVRPGADVAGAGSDGLLDLRNGIGRSGEKPCVLRRKHRQIIQMVADGEDLFTADTQNARNFAQSGAFVKRLVAEAGVDIVANNREIWNTLAKAAQIFVNAVHLSVVPRDEAKR